jgi:hypothetical protein
MHGTRLARGRIGIGAVAAVVLAASLFFGLRTGPSWPSAFCQPINRVISVDATRFFPQTTNGLSSVHFMNDAHELHEDIGTALEHAPTAKLRRELAIYRRATVRGRSDLQVTTALSTFDGDVRTQLLGCDDRPIGK